MKLHKYLFPFVLFIFLLSCSTEINEPEIIEKYEYTLSASEAKTQTEILLNETIAVLSETIFKKINTTKAQYEKLRLKSSDNYYFANGWFVWKDVIKTTAFKDSVKYIADYTSKIRFNTPDKTEKPDTTLSKFNVRTTFGFSNSIYGDEVDFQMNTALFLSKSSKVPIEMNATYKRHWVSVYEASNSDFTYSVNITADKLFYVKDNINRFEGKIIVNYRNFSFVANFTQSDKVKLLLYNNDNLWQIFKIELPSLKLLNSLSKQNKDIFPGYSTVKKDFISLIVNFPFVIQDVENE